MYHRTRGGRKQIVLSREAHMSGYAKDPDAHLRGVGTIGASLPTHVRAAHEARDARARALAERDRALAAYARGMGAFEAMGAIRSPLGAGRGMSTSAALAPLPGTADSGGGATGTLPGIQSGAVGAGASSARRLAAAGAALRGLLGGTAGGATGGAGLGPGPGVPGPGAGAGAGSSGGSDTGATSGSPALSSGGAAGGPGDVGTIIGGDTVAPTDTSSLTADDGSIDQLTTPVVGVSGLSSMSTSQKVIVGVAAAGAAYLLYRALKKK